MRTNSIKSVSSQVDIDNVLKAISEGGDIWNNKLLSGFKAGFKSYYRNLNKEQCCYCKRDTQDEFNMVLDIEHILPKSKYRQFMFTKINLSVSCKRCNMVIKREDISFVKHAKKVNTRYHKSSQYKFIHPNLDKYFEHIQYICFIVNDEKIKKYVVVESSSKGAYTYDYFDLMKLEIDSISKAQGVQSVNNNFVMPGDENIKKILNILNPQGI
ncbi:HNH endonuclease [Hymenobacter persicinus]|uniref:HNH endonuclease n=1 Tax=Hymenobacter persicinus TaxID=2025506 RepID=A0A4Q5LG04_9BACT|nr:HNH endonuclease [Hymenobacter persicinus]RYU83824.1 HNH endonuclease [Hymenobacter persicinus]